MHSRTIFGKTGAVMLTEADVVQMLGREVRRVGARRWAKDHGVSEAYVSRVLSGEARPGAKIFSALGLERVVVYRRVK